LCAPSLNATSTTAIYTLSLHDALPISYSLWLAGFEVKDIHMTDLIAGRENLEDVQMIVFVGGFSNSDVLGSAKGWAGAFLYNPKDRKSTRLNSSHVKISYAVFCLKKKR